MATLDQVRTLLDQVLSLDGRGRRMGAETPLLGSLPELDSMAVVTVITALEEHFGIVVEDDEVNADVFETLGALTAFVDSKLVRT